MIVYSAAVDGFVTGQNTSKMVKRIVKLAVELCSYLSVSEKMKSYGVQFLFENFSMRSGILFLLLLETVEDKGLLLFYNLRYILFVLNVFLIT